MQEEEARELVAAMVENSALESLVLRLGSFNESNDDEAEAVTNTLAIFENIVELSTNVGPVFVLTSVLHLVEESNPFVVRSLFRALSVDAVMPQGQK